jgi:hypothetical protein
MSFLQVSKSDSCTLFWLLIKRFATVSTGWKIINSRIPELALPRKRALPDSELLPLIGGDMAFCLIQKRERKKKKKKKKKKKLSLGLSNKKSFSFVIGHLNRDRVNLTVDRPRKRWRKRKREGDELG